jgi:serine/threonine protein kinase
MLAAIGQGREATVYRIENRESRAGLLSHVPKYFALRVPRKKAKDLHYMLVLCALPAHAHVVMVHAADPATGNLLLEYMPGGTLEHEVICTGMSEERAWTVVSQVSHGVAHLHAHGCMHGDVNPSNVLVGGSQRHCKLTDYFSECPVLGAPAYMAPEAARHAGVRASDVWSIGCLMLWLEGLHPWQDADVSLLDGSCVDLTSAAALLYHLTSRDEAMLGPPQRQQSKIFAHVLGCIFTEPLERIRAADVMCDDTTIAPVRIPSLLRVSARCLPLC